MSQLVAGFIFLPLNAVERQCAAIFYTSLRTRVEHPLLLPTWMPS